MAIFDLLSAAVSFISRWQPSMSPEVPESESLGSLGDRKSTLIHEPSVLTKKSLPYHCHATCSEVDALIARVVSIDMENQTPIINADDVLPSIEDRDDTCGPDLLFKRETSIASTEITLNGSPKSPRVTKINGLDIEGKYLSQVGHARLLCSQGWNVESILVYLKLARRGYEPLFSTAWRLDFPKFPSILFTNDDNAVFIKSHGSASLIHGVSDFDKLCEMGRDIRSAERRKIQGQETVAKVTAVANRAIQKYIRAVWVDGKLLDAIIEGRLIDQLVVVIGDPDSTIDELSELAEQKLHKRANRLLSMLAVSNECAVQDDSDTDLEFPRPQRRSAELPSFVITPPVIFGIVAYDTVVGVMACEPLSSGMPVRNLGFYHFNKQHEEVWNCISLAILVHWVRDSMMKVSDALGVSLERIREVIDPDL